MSNVEVLSAPIQSTGDKKEYRLIKLQNGVQAVLIKTVSKSSDKESLAAANVTIGVGSFDDPRNAMGLAHYLEHMVHMGSVKYPEESGYNDFLNANGGKRNAMTGSQYTSYFFDITEKALPEAIDRLAALIESPLLLKNPMQREREAVDSEYQMKKSYDSVRLQSILKSLIKESHPASLFDFGNLKSLKDKISDDDLQNELVSLHSKYVGNNMFVAVQSSRSLDEQQELVVKNFSMIKAGAKRPPKKAQTNVAEFFKPEFFDKIFYIKPKTGKAIVITWPVPPLLDNYKCSPMDYITAVFANEGDGGIINYLRQKHLVKTVGFHMEEYALSSNTDFALARLVCDLTDQGTESVEFIIETVFSYLLMLKETPVEEHRKLYEELKEKTERNFNFYTEAKPMENVMDVASNLMIYDLSDVLRGSSVFQEFDESSITSYIEALNQRKFNLIFLTERHESYDKKEKYFDTEFDEEDFPESIKKLWDERKLNSEFYLEKPNPFKTTNFEIFVNAEESTKYPVKIHDDEFIKVWHKLDDKFQLPLVNLRIKLFSSIITEAKENSTMLHVFENVLVAALKNKVSHATSAGYSITTSTDKNGLLLAFDGFSDKISLLVDIVTKFLPACVAETDEATFKTTKETMKESCEEKLLTTNGLNLGFFDKVLIENSFTSYDLYHSIDTISLEKLQIFSGNFFKHLRIEVLAQGNVRKSQALEVIEILKTNLSRDITPQAFELKSQSYKLPNGTSVLQMHSFMNNDSNSFIRNFYQIGPDNMKLRNLTRLVESILSPKAYDFLRSKEQLGYGVACKLDTKADVVGISLIVLSQETKHNFKSVFEKMNIFIDEVASKAFEELSDEDFEKLKESRIKTLTAEHRTLSEEANRNWHEISEQDYVFDRFELAAEGTRALTKIELQEFFKSFTNPDKVRKLSVQVIGNSVTDIPKSQGFNVEFFSEKIPDLEISAIEDIEEFQSNLTLYPVVKFELK